MDQDRALHTLKHGDKIYSLKWSRPQPGSQLPLMLARLVFLAIGCATVSFRFPSFVHALSEVSSFFTAHWDWSG